VASVTLQCSSQPRECNNNATATATAHLVALKAGCVLHRRQLCCCCTRSCLCQLGQVRAQLVLQLQGSGNWGAVTNRVMDRGGAVPAYLSNCI
jgi:hypothetical protein